MSSYIFSARTCSSEGEILYLYNNILLHSVTLFLCTDAAKKKYNKQRKSENNAQTHYRHHIYILWNEFNDCPSPFSWFDCKIETVSFLKAKQKQIDGDNYRPKRECFPLPFCESVLIKCSIIFRQCWLGKWSLTLQTLWVSGISEIVPWLRLTSNDILIGMSCQILAAGKKKLQNKHSTTRYSTAHTHIHTQWIEMEMKAKTEKNDEKTHNFRMMRMMMSGMAHDNVVMGHGSWLMLFTEQVKFSLFILFVSKNK